jgi:hypothetical protein
VSIRPRINTLCRTAALLAISTESLGAGARPPGRHAPRRERDGTSPASVVSSDPEPEARLGVVGVGYLGEVEREGQGTDHRDLVGRQRL